MAIYFSDAAQEKAAHVINSATFANTTRTSMAGTSGTSNTDLWTWTYNKQVSNSYVCAFGVAQGWKAYSGVVRMTYRLGSSYYMGGWSYNYTGDNYIHAVPIHIPLTNESPTQTTGNITMGIGYNVNPSNNANRPFHTLNPDNNDDSRLSGGTRSWVTVLEILL
tara:strand:- start:410 stop:901 length:492 start_codon:yes stop_codon:yes gene_type:complete